MMDCKNALEEAGGAVEQAVEILRKRGILKAAKRAGKIAAEGAVVSYIHAGGKIGVLVEVNCETDFVAKTEGFRMLANDIAMHIAASRPFYVSRADVPDEALGKEKDICLLEQAFIKDEDKTIEQLLTEKTAEIGEKISVRRFARFELGEGMKRETKDFADEVAAQL
jgi:elongation factor Ts